MTSYLNAFDPEAQGGGGAKCLPPLHVPRFEDTLLGPFLLCWSPGVHGNHFVVHVLPQTWTLPGFCQLLLQVSPESLG